MFYPDEYIILFLEQIQKNLRKRCYGIDILIFLILNSGQRVHCSALLNLFSGKAHGANEIEWAADEPAFERDIPVTHSHLPHPVADNRYLMEMKQELHSTCIDLDEAIADHDIGRMEDLKAKREFLQEHMLRIVTPEGELRNFEETEEQDYFKVYNALYRVFCKLEALDPDLLAYIKANLDSGLCYEWKGRK